MNKKLLLSATAVALVLPVLNNDAMAMMLKGTTAERIRERASNVYVGGGRIPQEVQVVIDKCATIYGNNPIKEVHNKLSKEGQEGHAFMLLIACMGGSITDCTLRERFCVCDIVWAYPEIQPYYLTPRGRRVTSCQDQAMRVLFRGPIYSVFMPTIPEETRWGLVEAVTGDIPLEEQESYPRLQRHW
jgi:hypothetical protein